MKLFEQGMGFEMHHILSAEEGDKLIQDSEKKLGKQMAKVKVFYLIISFYLRFSLIL